MIWTHVGNCPECGGPIMSSEGPGSALDVRRHCTAVCRHAGGERAPAVVVNVAPERKCRAVEDICRCGNVITQPRCPCDHQKRIVTQSCSACVGVTGCARDAAGKQNDCG